MGMFASILRRPSHLRDFADQLTRQHRDSIATQVLPRVRNMARAEARGYVRGRARPILQAGVTQLRDLSPQEQHRVIAVALDDIVAYCLPVAQEQSTQRQAA